MPASFYIIKPQDLASSVQAEHVSLKEAEQGLRAAQPGDYLVVQVVREAHVDPVPETVRVRFTATRTRAASPRPKRTRKPKTETTSGAPQTHGV